MTSPYTVLVNDARMIGSYSRDTAADAIAKARALVEAGAQKVVIRDGGGEEYGLDRFETTFGPA